MGYIQELMADTEEPLYQAHQHVIVLLGRVLGWLFAFLVFGTLAVLLLFFGDYWIDLAGRPIQWGSLIGLIALGTLIVPVVLIVRALTRRQEGEGLLSLLWRPVLIGLLILAFAVLVLLHPEWWPLGLVALALAVAPLFLLVHGFLVWYNERYVITNRRVMEIRGIINKLTRDSALEKVNDLELRQSVIGRLLGYGTVRIITGSDTGANTFHRIARPLRFKRALLNAKEQLQSRAVDELPYTTPAAPAAPAAPVTPAGATGGPTLPISQLPAGPGTGVADRLAELSDLRQKGLISEAEFQAKRQELLDQL